MAANLNPPSPIPAALGALAEYDQFIIWQAQTNPNGSKAGKIPLNPETLQRANAFNRNMWLPAESVYQQVALFNDGVTPINGIGFYGVGFVLTEPDPFFCLDIDDCLAGEWSALALDLIQRLPGTAIEVSHSGRGLHLWGRAASTPVHGCRNTEHNIELYSKDRFIALGRPDATGGIADCTAALASIVATYFSNGSEATGQGEIEWASAPCKGWGGHIDDGELIQAALGARPSATATFDNGVTFRDLWEANADALGKKWPHPTNPYDASSADASLAQHLVYWTGKDCERIKRLMLQSHLRRDKWERQDYLSRTIKKAVSLHTGKVHDLAHNKPQGDDAPPIDTLAAAFGAPVTMHYDNYGETDVANILTDFRRDLSCYDPERNEWYTRETGRLWRVDPRAVAIKRLIRRLLDQTKNLKRGSSVDGVLKAAQPDLAVIGPWDDDPELCGLPDDRVLVLADGTIRDAADHDRITRLLSCIEK